ARPGTPAL
nr:Chain C, ARTIFICIAL CONSENSUS SEQUENCE [synthetic construct]